MKIRVRSGDLNRIIQKNMLLKDWTEQDVLDSIKAALGKDNRKEIQLSDLTMVAEVPFDKDRAYFIETKSALKKLKLLRTLKTNQTKVKP